MQRSIFNRSLPSAMMVAAALGIAGCAMPGTGSNVGESLSPAMGGLPVNAPARPATPAAYPAVHDMPPPRADAVLDDQQQAKLQSDLAALRAKQDAETGTKAQPPAKPETKKKPASSAASQ